MKILALAHERPDVDWTQYSRALEEEAAAIWRLYLDGTVREMYFTADTGEAVAILECAGEDEARQALAGLPLVREGLLNFEVRALVPYDSFERLFRVKAPKQG